LLSSALLVVSLLTKQDFNLFKTKKKPQPPRDGPRERFLRGEATHKTNRTPAENSGRFDEFEYLDD
jgi:hypothetical protein